MIRIVIVDDEELICKSLKSMIGRINHALIEDAELCFDAFSARRLIIETKPHIVISDIKMPDMDGIQLVESVIEVCPDTRFIMLSGYNEYEYIRKSFKLGVVDYLLKPVSIEELEKILNDTIADILEKEESGKLLNPGGEHLQNAVNGGAPYSESYKTVINKVKQFVDTNYHRDINLSSAANHVCMNYSYFSKLFKDETGMTFSHYLLGIRMESAKKLLVDPEKKIQEVAREVGYGVDNTQNFTRAFKNYFGTPPRSFR